MVKTKAVITALITTLTCWLGALAVPVYILMGCNVIDYITGLLAAKHRTEQISSYKGIRGIAKKVCMWLLVVVGALVDVLLKYMAQSAGITIEINYIVAIFVALWLVANELISILENLIDIGVPMPPFLMPIVRRIKGQVEDVAKIDDVSSEESNSN